MNEIEANALRGVSVVVCTHNGSRRLRPTLEHIAGLESTDSVPWEFILVDNNSNDDTAEIARKIWSELSDREIRVIHEPIAGLSQARRAGMEAARYDIVSFVDDDNWLNKNWVSIVRRVFDEHPEVGACGSRNLGAYENVPPEWLKGFLGSLAIGEQGAQAGDVTEHPGVLWGAGLTIRKEAWQDLIHGSFVFWMSDRTGSSLIAGGDCEICFALRLGGWRLWYEPLLQLTHFMPSARCEWSYFLRLAESFGQTAVWGDAYTAALENRLPKRIALAFIEQISLIARHPIRFLTRKHDRWVGDTIVFNQFMSLGRLKEWHSAGERLRAQRASLRSLRDNQRRKA